MTGDQGPVTSGSGDADVRAMSGRPLGEVTLDAVGAGEVGTDDIRIHPDQLRVQAAVAERHGNPQLGANLRRAAELATLPDAEVMALYEALRPGRSTAEQLRERAADLRRRDAPRCADLLEEAARVHAGRGL